jgi:hypothetical protein
MHGRIQYPNLNRLSRFPVCGILRCNDEELVGVVNEIHMGQSRRVKVRRVKNASVAISSAVCIRSMGLVRLKTEEERANPER